MESDTVISIQLSTSREIRQRPRPDSIRLDLRNPRHRPIPAQAPELHNNQRRNKRKKRQFPAAFARFQSPTQKWEPGIRPADKVSLLLLLAAFTLRGTRLRQLFSLLRSQNLLQTLNSFRRKGLLRLLDRLHLFLLLIRQLQSFID